MKQNKPSRIFYFSSDIKNLFKKHTIIQKEERETETERHNEREMKRSIFFTTFYCNKKVMTLKIKAGPSYFNTH